MRGRTETRADIETFPPQLDSVPVDDRKTAVVQEVDRICGCIWRYRSGSTWRCDSLQRRRPRALMPGLGDDKHIVTAVSDLATERTVIAALLYIQRVHQFERLVPGGSIRLGVHLKGQSLMKNAEYCIKINS